MRYQAYPTYKDSSVVWLGELPTHWGVSSIKFLVSTPVTDGPHETPEIFNEGIPFVSAEAISNGKINFDKIRGYISEEEHKRFSKKYKPQRGDIYMVKSGATTGRIARVETDVEFNIWSPLAAIRCNPELANRYFVYHYLHSKEFQTAVQLSWSFGTQQNIGMGVIQNLAVPMPTLPEQTAIADFLDRETGRIDTLLAKKRTLLGLLKEKRSALISRTVTRGLPAAVAREFGLEPHTRFKDSGIEWLGEVPEGWEVKNVKHITRILRGKFSHRPRNDSRMYDGVYPFIQTGDIAAAKKYVCEYHQTLSEDGFGVSKQFPRGTLVMTIAANIGDIAILDFEACFPDSIVGFVPKSEVNLDFLYLLFTGMKPALLSTAILNTQLNLNIDRIGSLKAGLPPLPEQTAIAAYLDRETGKIDNLGTKVESAIERLQEYRTALITAAVTGKIDVREV